MIIARSGVIAVSQRVAAGFKIVVAVSFARVFCQFQRFGAGDQVDTLKPISAARVTPTVSPQRFLCVAAPVPASVLAFRSFVATLSVTLRLAPSIAPFDEESSAFLPPRDEVAVSVNTSIPPSFRLVIQPATTLSLALTLLIFVAESAIIDFSAAPTQFSSKSMAVSVTLSLALSLTVLLVVPGTSKAGSFPRILSAVAVSLCLSVSVVSSMSDVVAKSSCLC